MLKTIVTLGLTLMPTLISCDVAEDEPPRPYAFGYAAGRFPGHIDRTHSEVSDGSGIVQGSYSYVDPQYKIRKVDYVADKNGFHPVLNDAPAPLPSDTPVVAAAKTRHLVQYNRIANANRVAPDGVIVPIESQAVHNAKVRHLTLFHKIAEEHARISAQREAERLAHEAAHPNSLEQNV
ncbi:larval cuticle protein A2B-like [Cylas formicarius]|uniref:larval cuticle protein A2B-like n=1 Tax=Cylas formicarius TaxID=197179 RepID=UPI002958AD71|nr:larval cuticle protein A2B-like [Cylas formicarius]